MKRIINNKKLKGIALIIISIILFLSAILYSYNFQKSKKLPNSVKNTIKEIKKKDYQPKDDNATNKTEYINELPQLRETYGNNDILGKIEIPDLNINSLITRTVNNLYYLNYNIHKQKDDIGNPFFDFRNKDLNNDRQINIYGHNTDNEKIVDKLPLINLEAYNDEYVFNNYKNVYLYLDERKVTYKVIAVKVVNESDNEHMKLLFTNDEDFENHVNKLLSGSKYKDNEKINREDKLLVVQICHFNPKGTYLLIICKKK